MSEADSTLPADWFAQGDLDVQAAEILLAQGGPLPIIAFHLQQAAEKYLKGFLLSTGWPLRRIHDLEALIQEAIVRMPTSPPFWLRVRRSQSTTSRPAILSVSIPRCNEMTSKQTWIRSAR